MVFHSRPYILFCCQIYSCSTGREQRAPTPQTSPGAGNSTLTTWLPAGSNKFYRFSDNFPLKLFVNQNNYM